MDFYNFIEWKFNNGLFDFVDAAYVLHLEGSPRLERVKEQLFTNPLTNKTFLVNNPGFRKVSKPLPIQNSEADCAFSHYITCKHALANTYKTVLILEDDFILENSCLELSSTDITGLKNYINSDIDHYFLGCSPFIAIPTSWNLKHWKVIRGGTTHAMIHTFSGSKKIVEAYEKNPSQIGGIDRYIFANHSCHMYYKPLITQTFPDTENKLTCWGTGNLGNNIATWYINMTNLDKKTQPGYNFLYFISKISVLLIILLLVLVILIIKWIYLKFKA